MEGTMSNHDRENSQQASKRIVSVLHPAVYVALVGLTLWLAVAIWGFGYDGQTDYLLAIVTGFFGNRGDDPINTGPDGASSGQFKREELRQNLLPGMDGGRF
jgi:hypothetical protein